VQALERMQPHTLHADPTGSRLNQVERRFGLITQQVIRRGPFDAVADFKRKINEFAEHYNHHPRPFKWISTADSILANDCKVNGTER